MDEEKDEYFSRIIENNVLLQMKDNIKGNEKLGVTQNYNRDARIKLFDNDKSKKAFKKELFNERKTIKDPITGKTLHSDHNKAKAKYKFKSGSKKWAQSAMETDHIISLKKGHATLKKNPFLSDKDVNEILNDKHYNYRATSKSLNCKKQDKSDVSVALNLKNKISIKGRIKLVTDNSKANAGVTMNSATLTTKNIAGEFGTGAKISIEQSAIPILIESVHQLYLFANGEKDFDEAAKDVGKLTKNIALSGGMMKVLTTGVNNTLKISSSSVLQKIANSNQVTQIISVSLIIKDSLINYINGDIDGEEFFREIGEKGAVMISGTMGAIIGQALIPIPFVGAFIGSMIISTVCTGLYKSYSSLNEFNQKLERVNSIASQALSEMKRQRDALKNIIEAQFAEWDNQFNLGFEEVFNATMSDNVEGISIGLDRILNVFGENVKFKTFEEFDEFFMNENATLTL